MVIVHILDTKRTKDSNMYPVKVRVGYLKKAYFFNTGHTLSIEEYEQIMGDWATSSQQAIRAEIVGYTNKVQGIIKRLPVFSAETVRRMLALVEITSTLPRTNNILDWMEYKAKDCIEVNQSYGNAECYRSAAIFYKKQLNMEEIPFEYMTTARLFEVQRDSHVNYSISTIGKYSRHLRCVFNLAIAEGFIPKTLYPFGMHKYIPPTSRKRKHALTREALQALLNYKAVSEREQLYLDMFAFSFFANGLNLKDVVTLRYRDMSKDRIVKLREKTINSAQEPITIRITPQLIAIIERQGNKDQTPDNYIFPLLGKRMDEKTIFTELNKLRGKLQRTLTSIGKKLSIAGSLPHGTSRHCFANAMKQSGASDEYISETIGHSSVAVTKHYTSNFEEDGFTTQNFLTEYMNKKP